MKKIWEMKTNKKNEEKRQNLDKYERKWTTN